MTGAWSVPTILWLASSLLLWVAVLFLSFLLLGTLRALGLLRWRLEQLEATTPSRIGRSGLKPGKKAPDFTLPTVAGTEVALHDFAGRKVLLVFMQTSCGACHSIIPELNRLHGEGHPHVLVVNNGDREATRKWAGEARFPVLVQEHFSLSKRYEVFATPFAFLIDEKGVISSTGIINNKQHIGFVLAGRRAGANDGHTETEPSEAEGVDSESSSSIASGRRPWARSASSEGCSPCRGKPRPVNRELVSICVRTAGQSATKRPVAGACQLIMGVTFGIAEVGGSRKRAGKECHAEMRESGIYGRRTPPSGNGFI